MFYIGTDDGLYSFNLEDESLKLIEQCTVWSCLGDRQGNLWFATDNGIKVMRKDKGLHNMVTGSLPSNAVYGGILRDSRGRVWCLSNYGILCYGAGEDGQYTFSRHYSMSEEGPFRIPHNRVKKMVEDPRSGKLYAATDGGILIYNESSSNFDRYGIDNTHSWIYDILIDGEQVWYASFEGLYCFRGNEIEAKYTMGEGLSSDDVAQVLKDSKGVLWIRTRDRNVFTLNPREGVIEPAGIGIAQNGLCDWIISDSAGDIWLSAGSSIIKVSGDTAVNQKAFNLEPDEEIEVYSMSDFLGFIWVCSSKGIYLVDKTTFGVRNLDIGEIYVSVYYDREKNNLILGGLGRLSYLSADDLGRFLLDESAPVYITSVVVNSNSRLPLSELGNDRIDLKAEQNNISINISDFTYSKDVSRRFIMTISHKNKSWNESISGNTVFLPNLSPGRYTISFRPGTDQQDRIAGEALKIRIARPWYFSTPMFILYSLALIVLVVLIIHSLAMKSTLALEKEQRRVLLEQSRQKEEFFGNVAHEFKTPLSLVIAPLGKLINDCRDENELEVLKMAHENAVKLNSLIHNTIDYYRDTKTSGTSFIRSEVEFVEFARAIFESFKAQYPDNEFIFESLTDQIIADVDIVKMEMVLSNLMSNACKYTPQGGSVIMTLEKEEDKGRFFLKLSDTGIGIPKDELHLVFQRYFESSRSKGGHYDSTGIGLSLIKEYVEGHGGAVSVDSDEYGTTFTLFLPCKQSGSIPAEKEAEVNNSDDVSKPLIVLVDDNPQICHFLETILRDRYRCISTNNGKSGLKLCKDVVPDLIISDVMMPVMDGMEMCRQLREYAPLSTIPVIFLTAKGDKKTEEQSIRLNVDTFITKPFEFSTLVAKIDQLIGNKRRMEQKLRVEMISTPVDSQELSPDEKYLKKVTRLIEEHIDDDSLSVKSLCSLGGFNEKQLYRKTKQLTGMSTVEYIRSIRLKKAAILLQKGSFTVSEVMYSVGFNNASYFTRAFSSEYGKTPSEYLKLYRKQNLNS